MKKPIKLFCRSSVFSSIKEAKEYYLSKRQELIASNNLLMTGQLFNELNEIYNRYCQYTNEPLPNKVIGFRAGNTSRENNARWATTQCFSVHFNNNTVKEFSIINALTEIANHH